MGFQEMNHEYNNNKLQIKNTMLIRALKDHWYLQKAILSDEYSRSSKMLTSLDAIFKCTFKCALHRLEAWK